MQPQSRYLRWLVATAAAGLLFTVTFNALLDPQDLLGFGLISGIDGSRPTALVGGRIPISLRLAARRIDTLILGSSRAGALRADHPVFGKRRVLTAALMQTNMVEQGRILDYAADRQELEHVVLALDFFAFSSRRSFAGDFQRSAFGGVSPWPLLAKTLVSGQTFGLSIERLRNARPGESGGALTEIERSLAEYRNYPRRAFDRQLRRLMTRADIYGCFDYDLGRVAILRTMAERVVEEGAELRVLLSPIHAVQREALQVLGLRATYEDWKRDVTAIVHQVGGPGVPLAGLWDFSGYSAQTTEKVPGGRAQMNGYLESSHYKEALGDTILERIFDPAAPERHGDGFGVRLRPGNIEPHLSRLRAERAHYLSRNREVQLWAERLARSTAPGRKAACRRARRASG
jgi:hypothetical protein